MPTVSKYLKEVLISVLVSVIITTGTIMVKNFKNERYEKRVKSLIEESYIGAVNDGNAYIHIKMIYLKIQ